MYRRIVLLLTSLLVLLWGGVMTANAVPTPFFIVHNATVTCNSISLLMFRSGDGSTSYTYETLFYDDFDIYMDEYFTSSASGYGTWNIYNKSDRGLQTSLMPAKLKKSRTYHILITTRNALGIAQAYAHVKITNCSTGTYEVRHGAVDTITTNATMETNAGGFPQNWQFTNASGADGTYCSSGGYLSDCSLRLSSSSLVKKKAVNSVTPAGTYPNSTAGVRIEARGWQTSTPTKDPTLKGVITYVDGTKQAIKVKMTARVISSWQYYGSLPVNVRGAIASIKTQFVVPIQGVAGNNYVDNFAVLIYRQSEMFHITRDMPPLPMPGEVLPVFNNQG